ncbi:NACHT domain-containing protein [Phanerochaete sordida]|uniref:NACHT domain-containing protein n=1 Tax=Phanerochaete sordida TaxID=48140 RepID=A0A9P3L801_9APHY|nr:NACHT domain-containing protein [Phanerochaete sordida]
MLPERRRNGRRALDTALDVAGPVLDALEVGLGLTPVPGLDLIPKALSGVVKKVKVARANEEQREKFLETVRLLASTIGATAAKAKRSEEVDAGDEEDRRRAMEDVAHSPDFLRAMQNLVRTFDELQELADTLVSKGGLQGFLQGVVRGSRNNDTLKSMQRRLATAIDAFQLDSHRAIDQGIQDIKRLLKNSDEQRIISQLAWADAGYRAVDYLKSGFVDGTRKDLMKKLHSWLEGRFPEYYPKQFCLLTAGAGMGKSAVAHRLCRYIFDKKFALSGPVFLGASFFFVRGNGDKASALLLAPTIARQLASCHPALCTYISSAASKYVLLGGQQQVGFAFDILLGTLPTTLPASMGRNARVVIVIDGLDECAEQNLVCEALTRLFALVRRLPWLYVFAASRPEPQILHTFESNEGSDVVWQEDMGDAAESYEDVELYLRTTVPKIRSYAPFVRDHPRQLGALVGQANGLFIYAQTLVRFLDTYCDYPEEGFRLALSSKRDGVSSVDSLYLQILESAFPPDQLRKSPYIHAHLLALLHIITLTQRQCVIPYAAILGSNLCETSVIQRRLSGAVTPPIRKLSEETIVSMLSRLRAVLRYQWGNEVTALHASFGEFLCNPARCTNQLYQIDEGEGHAGLVSASLATFTLETMTSLYSVAHAKIEDGHVHLFVAFVFWELRRHIQCATWTPELQADLAALVGSSRMPIMLRMEKLLYVFGRDGPGPFLGNLTYGAFQDLCLRAIQSDHADSSNGSPGGPRSPIPWLSIPGEYLKFFAYTSLCRDYLMGRVTRAPTHRAKDIRQFLLEYVRSSGDLEDWAAPVQEAVHAWSSREPFDMERYRTVIQALKADIDRDLRVKDWWYNQATIRGRPEW